MFREAKCGCTQESVMGKKRPKLCEHGNLFVKPGAHTRSSSGGTEPRREWSAALAKVESEDRCRVCGATTYLEAAHIMGRKHDEPVHPGSRVLYVDPNRIVVLCGPFPDGCHGEYDHKRLDLLSYLRPEEQTQAVEDAGGIEQARRRLLPSAYREWELAEVSQTTKEAVESDRPERSAA